MSQAQLITVPKVDFKPGLAGIRDLVAWTRDKHGKTWIRCKCGVPFELRARISERTNPTVQIEHVCGYKILGILAKWEQ